jgi:hypothetical protein
MTLLVYQRGNYAKEWEGCPIMAYPKADPMMEKKLQEATKHPTPHLRPYTCHVSIIARYGVHSVYTGGRPADGTKGDSKCII